MEALEAADKGPDSCPAASSRGGSCSAIATRRGQPDHASAGDAASVPVEVVDCVSGMRSDASRRLLTQYMPPTTRKRQTKLTSMVPAEKELRKGRTTLFRMRSRAVHDGSSIFCMRKSLILYCINLLEPCPPAGSVLFRPPLTGLRTSAPPPVARRFSRKKDGGPASPPFASPPLDAGPVPLLPAAAKGTYPQGHLLV